MGVFLRAGGEFLMHVTGISTLAGFHFDILGRSFTLGFLELMMTGLLAIVLVYTVLGGMLSVLITDYLQFLVKGAGIVIVSLMVLWYIPWSQFIPGLSAAHEAGQKYAAAAAVEAKQVDAAAGAIEKSQGPDAAAAFREAEARKKGDELKANEGELAKQSVLLDTKSKKDPPKAMTMAHPFNPFTSEGLGFGWVLWQAMTAIAVVTTWQTTIARVLAARDSDTAKKVYRGTWFYFAGRFCLPGLWGAGAFLYFAWHGGLPAGTASDTAMPEFLRIILPTGLLGIVLAAMLAAEMSTDSGYLLTWATVIYNDLITPLLRRPMSDRARLLTVRLVVVAIGLFLVFWGLWYEMSGSMWEYLAVTGNIYLASLFSLLIGALYWRGANSWGAISAIVLGACGPLTFLVINAIVGKDSPYRVPGEVAGLAAFGLAFAGMVVGSLIGQAAGKCVPLHAPETAPQETPGTTEETRP
jgi:Na+/proline symporter